MSNGPVVLPASLVISLIPGPGQEVPLEDLAEYLAVGDGEYSVRDIGVVTLPEGDALRRVVYRVVTVGSEVEPVPALNVEYLIPVPAGQGALLNLSFSTSLVTLETAYTELFDAVAETLTWRW